MAKQTISLGTTSNDGTGDPLRTAFTKTNANFTELYTADASLQPLDADLTAIAALVGTSGFLKKTSTNTWSLDTSTYLTAITSNQITTALGYTPYNGATNSSAFLTGITSAQIISALGYTPYSAANPTGYVTSVQLVIPDQTSNSGKFLTTNGTATSWATIPTLNQNTTGSAATLTTPRAINGVNFDGSAAITVTAAAGTLSGATLASGVTASSLTSVGTIATGTWQGSVIGSTYGGTGVNNGANTLTLAGNVSHAGSFTQTFTATANTTLTLPVTGTLATLTGTETFTNKTLTSPTLTTPALGVATATSINGLTVSTTTGTLTLVNGSTLVTAGAFSTTLTATAATNVTLPTTGTLATLAGTETFTNKTLTAPVLGGTTTSASGNIVVKPATNILEIQGDGSTVGQIQLNCPVNTHGQKIASQPHSEAATNKLTLPGGTTIGNADAVLVSDTGTQTLTNKTAGTATATSTAASLGYLGIPQSATTTTATLAIGDAGKHIYVTTASQTITIPANASVAYPIGTTIGFIAGPSATTVTIAITSDTMYLGGTGTTGSRTLAAHGMATAVKVAATTWYISGNGLT